jgi:putative ABC transport system substrate-binding protein
MGEAMKRRQFITLVGGAAAWPALAQAQERMRRVGIFMGYSEDDPETKARLVKFRREFESLGWSEGRNVRIDLRFAAGNPDQFRGLAKELIDQQPDVILAHTTPVTASLRQETRTIPIVFVNVSDPVGSGFVINLARPGGNLTGVLQHEAGIAGKWLALLKEIAPHITRAALLAGPKTTAYDYFVRAAEAAAPSLAIELVPSPIDSAAGVDRVIDTFARVPNGGLVVLPDQTTFVHRDRILAQAATHLASSLHYPAFCCRGWPHVVRDRPSRHVWANRLLY